MPPLAKRKTIPYPQPETEAQSNHESNGHSSNGKVSSNGKEDTTANKLRTFASYGLDVHYEPGVNNVTCECPFCNSASKFGIKVSTGQWQCFYCGKKGNIASFLQQLHSASDSITSVSELEELATSRGLKDPMTLNYWGVVKSIITGEWLVPGWNTKGVITHLYRYTKPSFSEKKFLVPATDLSHAIHGVNLFNPKKGDVYICEGAWDAMILWETLRYTKSTEEGLQLTGSEDSSLLADINVLAVPGSLVFRSEWSELFTGRRVFLLYDNDYPRTVKGTIMQGAGYRGMKKAAAVLATFSPRVREVHWLRWGNADETHNPNLPDKYDIRDVFSSENSEGERIAKLPDLLNRLVPIPADWVEGRTVEAINKGKLKVQCRTCTSWAELVNAGHKAMVFTEGIKRGTAGVLASIVSVESNGDPLWIKLIGPPSTGKSTIAESVSVADEYVYPLSTLTGFHSGWKTDRNGEEDHGLLPKIDGKTLIVKDADTILSASNKDKILSEARDLYDNVCRTHYLHGVNRQHNDIRTTIVLSGTESLHELDGSELGERFLDIHIMKGGIDTEIEKEVCRRKIYTAWNSAGIFAGETEGVNASRELLEFKQLTGGYVQYLRQNAKRLINVITSKEPEEETVQRLMDMGTFVAYIRARPSKRHDEGDDREFAVRLCSQHTRLAICIATVFGKEEVDEEVLEYCRHTALDTSRGRTYEICRHLYDTCSNEKGDGLSLIDLSVLCNSTEDRKRKMMRFLRKIGAVECFRRTITGPDGTIIQSSEPKWRLTTEMKRLWRSVVLNELD